LYQKLLKSVNWFSSYSRKCLGCFFETLCSSVVKYNMLRHWCEISFDIWIPLSCDINTVLYLFALEDIMFLVSFAPYLTYYRSPLPKNRNIIQWIS